MNPILEKVSPLQSQSFRVKEEILDFIKIGWHFHPEYELVLFTESTGKMFIGDFTDNFGPGEILLLGPNIPHYMRNDQVYYEGRKELRIRAIVIHFNKDFCGKDFFLVPELANISKLLQLSDRGLRIQGDVKAELVEKMEQLLLSTGFERLQLLLYVLEKIAVKANLKTLSSAGFSSQSFPKDNSRINKVFDHILKNYTNEIQLDEVATLVNMSVSAFCKFYKKHTGKTFTESLNEIRIGHACKLFMNSQATVSEICFQSGFNNLSYFHRNFRKNTGYSPLEYKRQFFRQ